MIAPLDPFHRERLRWHLWPFLLRNLDYLGISLALIAFVIVERLTAAFPPT
jgi:hypothetical protein